MHSQDAGSVTCSGDPKGASTVRIVATDPSGMRKFFDGQVTKGGAFAINAANANRNRLGGETRVKIFDTSGNLLQEVRFHTSCSQPLNLGDKYGSLLLVGFVPNK